MKAIFNTNIRNAQSLNIEDAKSAMTLRTIPTPNFRYQVNRMMGIDGGYTDMEYDLSEHGRIIDTESLVASAFRKKKQLVLKEGFMISGKDQKNLDYINKRLIEIEYVTGQSFRDLVDEITENMINFNNCFLMKYRRENASSGNVRETPTGSEIKPVAGYYVLAAPTIDTANNKLGQIIKYRHRITHSFTREFSPRDILHMYASKRTGMTIGTPPLESVKDDIMALRSIEQSAENMIYRNASPFIHVQVGDDKKPARMLQDGTSEVDLYSTIITEMPEAGGVSTPHNVKINMLGAESQALRLESYLNHFKDRVLAGLCISAVDLGIGNSTTGGSAALISEALKDDVRSYQEIITNFITNYLFTELLLESPRYKGIFIIPYPERISFTFEEADIDKRIKLETHALNLYQGGLLNQGTALKSIGYGDMDGAPEINPVTGAAMNKAAKSGAVNTAKNLISPVNQHNKKTLKIKDALDQIYNIEQTISNILSILEDETGNSLDPSDIRLKMMYNKAVEILNERGEESAVNYIDDFLNQLYFELEMENT